jgi:hypothetical protein
MWKWEKFLLHYTGSWLWRKDSRNHFVSPTIHWITNFSFVMFYIYNSVHLFYVYLSAQMMPVSRDCNSGEIMPVTVPWFLHVTWHRHSRLYNVAHNTIQQFIKNWQSLEEPGTIDFTASYMHCNSILQILERFYVFTALHWFPQHVTLFKCFSNYKCIRITIMLRAHARARTHTHTHTHMHAYNQIGMSMHVNMIYIQSVTHMHTYAHTHKIVCGKSVSQHIAAFRIWFLYLTIKQQG